MSQELKEKVAKACREMYEKDMIFGNGGNISAFDSKNETIVITPTGSSLRNIDVEDLVVVDKDGEVLEGKQKPSKEVHQHAKLYEKENINAVVHVHPPNVIAISVALDRFPLVTEPSKGKLGEVPMLKNHPAGSSELAESTQKAFKDEKVKAAIIKRHALITVGSNMKEACDTAELVEDTARVYLGTKTIQDKVEDFQPTK